MGDETQSHTDRGQGDGGFGQTGIRGPIPDRRELPCPRSHGSWGSMAALEDLVEWRRAGLRASGITWPWDVRDIWVNAVRGNQ